MLFFNIRFKQICTGIIVSIFMLSPLITHGQSDNQNDTIVRKILVGIKETPPFIIKQEDGSYTGLSIDLWETIAIDENIVFDYIEYPADGLINILKDLADNKIDISINPLTVTSERIRKIDFTHPFYSSGITIASSNENENSIWAFIKNVFSVNFGKVVTLLVAVILIFGFLLWFVERKHNKDQFRRGLKGVGDGFWWSAVTMTTVGYGDKSPQTTIGRLIAVIWMFTAVIITSSFTGSIAASLSSKNKNDKIETISDLKGMKVGTMKKTSSELFLLKNHIHPHQENYHSIEEGLKELAEKKIDAFIYDEPILKYYVKHMELEDKVQILPNKFNLSYYSFGLPKHSLLMEKVNPNLIGELESALWLTTLNKYNLDKP